MSLTPRDRRTLALGATIIGALVISARVLPAWRRWQTSAQAAAHDAALAIARSRSQLLGRREVHDSLVVRRARLVALRGEWLEGDTPAAAGAELAGEVSNAGERAGVTVGAMDIRVDSGAGSAFWPVRVQTSATGDIQGIVNLLAGIESDRIDLSIRTLSIDAANVAAPPNQPEILRADFIVEAPWRRAHE